MKLAGISNPQKLLQRCRNLLEYRLRSLMGNLYKSGKYKKDSMPSANEWLKLVVCH
jgi:hypothetical protein